MKVILFDKTEIEAKVKEESNSISMTISFAKMTDYAKVFELLSNSNLCQVTIVYDDGSKSEYKNLKFFESNTKRVGNVHEVTTVLTSKTEFELRVDELTKSANSDYKDLTKTQVAIVELYELIIPLLSL